MSNITSRKFNLYQELLLINLMFLFYYFLNFQFCIIISDYLKIKPIFVMSELISTLKAELKAISYLLSNFEGTEYFQSRKLLFCIEFEVQRLHEK